MGSTTAMSTWCRTGTRPRSIFFICEGNVWAVVVKIVLWGGVGHQLQTSQNRGGLRKVISYLPCPDTTVVCACRTHMYTTMCEVHECSMPGRSDVAPHEGKPRATLVLTQKQPLVPKMALRLRPQRGRRAPIEIYIKCQSLGVFVVPRVHVCIRFLEHRVGQANSRTHTPDK